MTTQNIDPKVLKETFSRRQLRQGRKRWRKRALEPLLAQIGAISSAGMLTGFLTGMTLFLSGGLLVTLVALWTTGFHHLVDDDLQWQQLSFAVLGYGLLIIIILSVYIGWRLARSASQLLALHGFSIQALVRRSWSLWLTLVPAAFYFVLLTFLIALSVSEDFVEAIADVIEALAELVFPFSRDLEEFLIIVIVGLLFFLATLPVASLLLRLTARVARLQFWMCGFQRTGALVDVRMIRLRVLLSMLALSMTLIACGLALLWLFWEAITSDRWSMFGWNVAEDVRSFHDDMRRDPGVATGFFLFLIAIGFQIILYASLVVTVSMMALRDATLGDLAEPRFINATAGARRAGGFASIAVIVACVVWYDMSYGIGDTMPVLGQRERVVLGCGDGANAKILNQPVSRVTPDSHHLHFVVAKQSSKHSILHFSSDNEDTIRSRINREPHSRRSGTRQLSYLVKQDSDFRGHLATSKVSKKPSIVPPRHAVTVRRECLDVLDGDDKIIPVAFGSMNYLIKLDYVDAISAQPNSPDGKPNDDGRKQWRTSIKLSSVFPDHTVELRAPIIFIAGDQLGEWFEARLNVRRSGMEDTQTREPRKYSENYFQEQDIHGVTAGRSVERRRDELRRSREEMLFELSGPDVVEIELTLTDDSYESVEFTDKPGNEIVPPPMFALLEVVPRSR